MRYFCFSLARPTDREEIRRKLAMGSEDDHSTHREHSDEKSRHFRPPTEGAKNLQLCYMNHAPAPSEGAEVTSDSTVTSSPLPTHFCQSRYHHVSWAAALKRRSSSSSSSTSSMSSSSSSSSMSSSCGSLPSPTRSWPSRPSEESLSGANNNNNNNNNSNNSSSLSNHDDGDQDRGSSTKQHQRLTGREGSNPRFSRDPSGLRLPMTLPLPTPPGETLAQRQQRLQQEAKVALAQASIMARMQIEVERRNKRRSIISDDVGDSDASDWRRLKIPQKLLQEMNFAQLQVLVNDLHSQIESLNEELVHLLIEKDDLHMEQDSMLVDIEDLNSFAQRMSETNNNKTPLRGTHSPQKKTTSASSPSNASAASRRQPWSRNPGGVRTTESSSPLPRKMNDAVNGNE